MSFTSKTSKLKGSGAIAWRLALCLLLVFSIVLANSGQGSAITQRDLNAIRNNTPFFSLEPCGTTGGPAGDGPLFGPAFPKISDTAALAKNIVDWIKKVEPTSGLAANGDDFVKFGQQYNVNPVLLLAVGQKESQLGTDGSAGNPPKHNFWGNNKGATSYPNYAAAIEGYFENLRNNSAYAKAWAKGAAATVEDIIYIASPPSENSTAAYVQFVKDIMKDVLTGLDAAGSTASPTEVDATCGKTDTAPGTAAETAKKLLALWGGNLTGNPEVFQDLTDTSLGKTINNTHSCGNTITLDAAMLNVMLTITTKYKLYVYNIVTGHGCDRFYHPKGMATDIGKATDLATGQSTNFTPGTSGDNQAVDRAFVIYVASLLPKDAGLGQSNCAGRSGAPMPDGIRFFSDTCHHQHIQMKTGG